MASSNVTHHTTPSPLLKEETNAVVAVVRKMNKIKIDLSTISRILNVTCETCEIINNDVSEITVIDNNMNDDQLNINRNNICDGDCTEEENEKCGYYCKNRDKKLEYQKNITKNKVIR